MKKFSNSRVCPVLVGFTIKGEARIIYCGQWTCQVCSRKLARKWSTRVRLHINADVQETGEPWFMLTVTLGSGYKDVPRAFTAVKALWKRLKQRLDRETGKPLQYCAFVEGQPKRQSMPHFHVLLNRFPSECLGAKGTITKHATHDYAVRMGWGHQAELEQVSDERAADYVAKYTSKGAGVVPRGFRRVRVSRGFRKLKVDASRFLIVPARKESIVDYLNRVSDITGVLQEELHALWVNANETLVLTQEDNHS